MLVFVDESGDTGLKIAAGASGFFTVALVLFEEDAEAQACNDRIIKLRTELVKPADFEFHFNDNSNQVRKAFLEAIAPYEFFYLAFVIDKAALYGPTFHARNSLYKWVCGMVFENAKPFLDAAVVTIDKSGDRGFRKELAAYLRQKINDKRSSKQYIKEITMQDSHRHNLIQLADMISGAVARSMRDEKKDKDQFRKIAKHRELSVLRYPS